MNQIPAQRSNQLPTQFIKNDTTIKSYTTLFRVKWKMSIFTHFCHLFVREENSFIALKFKYFICECGNCLNYIPNIVFPTCDHWPMVCFPTESRIKFLMFQVSNFYFKSELYTVNKKLFNWHVNENLNY